MKMPNTNVEGTDTAPIREADSLGPTSTLPYHHPLMDAIRAFGNLSAITAVHRCEDDCDGDCPELQGLAAERDAAQAHLVAEVSRLREDRERLDWLEARVRADVEFMWMYEDGSEGDEGYLLDFQNDPHPTLRAAIDAARTPAPENAANG